MMPSSVGLGSPADFVHNPQHLRRHRQHAPARLGGDGVVGGGARREEGGADVSVAHGVHLRPKPSGQAGDEPARDPIRTDPRVQDAETGLNTGGYMWTSDREICTEMVK